MCLENKSNQFVFGYGSLINLESVCNTIEDKTMCENTYAVRIVNMKRGWYFRVSSSTPITLPWTTLVCSDAHHFTTNGILLPITDDELSQLDLREKGYRRMTIDTKRIECLCKNKQIPQNATVYYYGLPSSEFTLSNHDAPLLQSYIDTCLSGCIRIDSMLNTGNTEYPFTTEFLNTTQQWDKMRYWINDRVHPRRPHVFVPDADIIDQSLQKIIL